MNPYIFSSQIKRSISRLSSIAAILLLILLASPTPAHADTSVCGPVSGTWTPAGNNYIVTCDIQVLDGTTLTIRPGVVVKFNLGTSLRVDGELIAQGATFTTNDPTPTKGDWGHIWFTTTSVDATLDTNGNYVSGSIIEDSLIEWGGGGAGVNGALETTNASPLIEQNTIRNSNLRGIYAIGRSSAHKIRISNNGISGNYGGGIYVSVGQVVSNTVQGNSVFERGGGIYASNSDLTNNDVIGNTASSGYQGCSVLGGGIYTSGGTLTNNTVSSNTASGTNGGCSVSGGGIYTIGGTLIDNTISGNTITASYYPGTGSGGGIYASGGTLTNNTASGNTVWGTANAYGGGIYASSSTVSGNIADTNTTVGNVYAYGGGIYAGSSSVTNNTITANLVNAGSAIGDGGGIYADGGSISNNTISDNTASGGSTGRGGGVYGTISSILRNTISGNSANRGGAIFAYKGTVTSNTVLTNTTSLSGTLYIDQGTATLNVFRGNNAVAGGAIYGAGATLTGNTAENNSANFGAGIYSNNSIVRGNMLSGNNATSDGGGLYASGGAVSNNTLTGNTVPSWGHGSGAYIVGVTDFSYNDVLTNTTSGGTSGGVSISGQPVVQYNNLYGNLPYDAEVVSAQNVTGTLNYWGLSTCNSIPAQIYDGNDAPGRGTLAYAPSLYSQVPVAQLATPENLALSGGENQITLDWSPIPAIPNVGCRVPGSSDPDLVYRVYYDTDSACGPYDGKGLPDGNSPITVGTNTQIALSGVSQADFVFVITAYDYLGRESAYSNIVGNVTEEWHLFLPAIIR